MLCHSSCFYQSRDRDDRKGLYQSLLYVVQVVAMIHTPFAAQVAEANLVDCLAGHP